MVLVSRKAKGPLLEVLVEEAGQCGSAFE